MRLHPTFAVYVGRQFLICWFSTFFVLVGLIALLDTIEILRQTASKTNLTALNAVAMMAFKLPHLAQEAIPFSILFGGMLNFWRLNRHQEFIVARSSGISAWEFLLPTLLICLSIGVIKATIYNPFASAMMLQFEQLKNQHTAGRTSFAAISEDGLWLRQKLPNGHYILHAATIDPTKMTLERVIIFRMANNKKFVSRIDAMQGVLGNKNWLLKNVIINAPDTPTRQAKTAKIPTDLTSENIQNSFATPETMSFWVLPGFIEVLEKAGFSGLRHRIYWHSLIADPFLLCAMTLFAAAFTLRAPRRGGVSVALASGLATGFVIYFASDVIYALGLSARLPPMLAAWSPAMISCLLGAGILFHLEDG
jgi:lipopolysaccharide export system permease protein